MYLIFEISYPHETTDMTDVPGWKGEEVEEAASHNDTKILYQIVMELTGMRSNTNMPVRDKGKMLMNEAEQDRRWMEHFRETLN